MENQNNNIVIIEEAPIIKVPRVRKSKYDEVLRPNIKTHTEANLDYYYRNAEDIKLYKTTKIPCNICGCMISRGNMNIHKKTLKCRNFQQ